VKIKFPSSGAVLVVAAALGLIIANSPISDTYFDFLALGFTVDSGIFYLHLTVLKIINYGLMSIFFYVVALEIKSELVSGHLSTVKKAAMPFVAALGGMALPAGIYFAVAGDVAPKGWAVPVATDIALAVGLLAMMGPVVTNSLRSFLLALAVIDDIGAILIIALVYSSGFVFSWLFASMASIILILILQKIRINSAYLYILCGLLLWYGFYRAGLHPTLAGVILGLLTPVTGKSGSTLKDLETRLHPYSSLIIVPIFALANTGVVITEKSLTAASTSVIAWGIFLGLVIGKPLGVLISALAASKAGVAQLPEGASVGKLTATGSAAGIGFTVALFIADLAFENQDLQNIAVVAVIAASIVSAALSSLIFTVYRSSPRRK
jgi:NhaA family Na+:H+ antiporter